MYSIVGNNREVGIVETPTYILLQPNGFYALCKEGQAQGIVFDGAPYQLIGRPVMKDGLEEVCIVEVNAGARIIANQSDCKANAANIDYMAMMTGVDIPIEEMNEDESERAQTEPSVIAAPNMIDAPGIVEDGIVHSQKFERVKSYYDSRLWNKAMVHNAVGRWITSDEEIEIVGKSND